eukprot:Filipodium_phascolosomae@DN1804_c0_g1_i2.p1
MSFFSGLGKLKQAESTTQLFLMPVSLQCLEAQGASSELMEKASALLSGAIAEALWRLQTVSSRERPIWAAVMNLLPPTVAAQEAAENLHQSFASLQIGGSSRHTSRKLSRSGSKSKRMDIYHVFGWTSILLAIGVTICIWVLAGSTQQRDPLLYANKFRPETDQRIS